MKTRSIPFLLIFLLSFSIVLSDPQGVNDITRGASERGPTSSSTSQQSAGGNVTPLFVNAGGLSKRWQGFFGNISGSITLSDAAENVLYNWNDVNPSGEIFAANHSTVTWANLNCVNFSSDSSDTAADRYNVTSLNEYIGYTSASDQAKGDSINSTFNLSFTGNLEVGSLSFNSGNNCSMVTLNDATGYQQADFQELLMTDNVSIIFTSIIENSLSGFQSSPSDFQMIVGVNGTDDGTTRDYFFFVELG